MLEISHNTMMEYYHIAEQKVNNNENDALFIDTLADEFEDELKKFQEKSLLFMNLSVFSNRHDLSDNQNYQLTNVVERKCEDSFMELFNNEEMNEMFEELYSLKVDEIFKII